MLHYENCRNICMSFRNHSLWLILVMLLLLKAVIQFMNMQCLFNDKYVFWKEKFSLVGLMDFFFGGGGRELKLWAEILWQNLEGITHTGCLHCPSNKWEGKVWCEQCLSVGPHNIVQLVPSPHQYSPSFSRKMKINNAKCVSICVCVYLANKFFSVSCSFSPATGERVHSRWILTDLKDLSYFPY